MAAGIENSAAEEVDFGEEANCCLRLAEIEAVPEVKTIFLGMALGWLTLASEMQPYEDATLLPGN